LNLKLQAVELKNKIENLTIRERVIGVVTVVAVLFGVYDQLVLSPFLKHREEAKQQLASVSPKVKSIQLSIESLLERQARDPNLQIQTVISQRKEKLEELDAVIKRETKRLIDPKDMTKLLGYLLSRQSKLKIDNVKSVSGETIYFDEEEKVSSGLFRHSLTLSLEGTYLQVKNYLKKVEELAEEIYWDDMTFESKLYPIGTLELNVHTLSTSKELIGVY